MAVEIKNKSGDIVIVSFFGSEIEIENEACVNIETSEKSGSITVIRKRIPQEFTEEKQRKKFSIYEDESKPACRVQLKLTAQIELDADDAVIEIQEKVSVADTLHEDVLFAGYDLTADGGTVKFKKDSFANADVKKEYLSKQIKSTVFPVGIIGVAVTVVGLYCLISAMGGDLVKIFDNEVTKSSGALVLLGGAAVFGVFVSNMIKIFKRSKELS